MNDGFRFQKQFYTIFREYKDKTRNDIMQACVYTYLVSVAFFLVSVT